MGAGSPSIKTITTPMTTKKALIIGNDDYTVDPLRSCVNDARDIATKLANVGFSLTRSYNLTCTEMSMRIGEFIKTITEGDLVVFFFSGHGIQYDGENYLVPIDNQCIVNQPSLCKKHATSLQATLDEMNANNPYAVIFLLDCSCVQSKASADTKATSENENSLNFVPMQTDKNSLIAFTCGPNQNFLDNSNQRNSLFTYRLLERITEPNLRVEEMLNRVSGRVSKDSNGKLRIHQSRTLLTAEIYFNYIDESDVTSKKTRLPEIQIIKSWLELRFNDKNKTSIMKPHEMEKLIKVSPPEIEKDLLDRIPGSMMGLAVGDALGAHVEFRPHDFLLHEPVTDLEEGGTWGLDKGQFTDDTSMALCLALSLIACQGLNLYDQLVRYKWWFKHGYMSSTGQCFDIGAATKSSIEEFERRQTDFAQQHRIPEDEMDYLSDPALIKEFEVKCSKDGVAGNGSLMRLAPVPLFFFRHPSTAVAHAGRSSQVTHGDQKATDACRYYAALIVAALHGKNKDEILDDDFYNKHADWFRDKELQVDILNISRGSYKRKRGYDDGIRGGGYVVKALEAALWAFWSTKTFEDGALAAVNLGDDTDTTAAIYGQLAGAYYGLKELPKKWTKEVYAQKFILDVCSWIGYRGKGWYSKYHSLSSSTEPVTPNTQSMEAAELLRNKLTEQSQDHIARPSTAEDYDECLTWSCVDVSQWLESLDPCLIKYVDAFKRVGVDGQRLLKCMDHSILEAIGIDSEKHQSLILKGINKLKKEVSTEFYEEFHGDDYASVWAPTKPNKNDLGHLEENMHDQMKSWIGVLPQRIRIEGMDVVPYSAQYRIFLQQILSLEYQCGQGGFLMTLDAKLVLDDQQKMLTRLRKYKRETYHKRHETVCIVRGWYGCTHEEMSEICQDGFKNKFMVKLGPSENDKGFCFKSSFKAAAEGIGVRGCVIMCYIILRHPFPTIIQPDRSKEENYQYRYHSDGRHSIYQKELPKSTSHQGNKNDRESTDVNDGCYDEFVTFQKKEILPQVVVYLKLDQS